MDRKLLVIVAVGLVVMGLSAWIAYPEAAPPIPEKERRFMHCPHCLRELRYDVQRAKKGCPECGPRQALVPTRRAIADTGPPPGPLARAFVPVLLEVNLLLVVLICYTLYTRRRSKEEEEFLYMECGCCDQKLRYRAVRIGQMGQCPRCKHRLVFPPPADEEAAARFWQARWWQERWRRSRSWWKARRSSA
jgi:hypothetical protein